MLRVSDGLSQGMIYQISQDSDGFLWIGTKNGLNRYDGVRFYQIESEQHGIDLSNITVTCQLEDGKGRLWVGTEGEGLFMLEKSTGSIFYCASKSESMPLPTHIITIQQDSQGNIWLGTFGGVFRVRPEAVKVKKDGRSTMILEMDQVYRSESFCKAVHIAGQKVYWSEDGRLFSASFDNPFEYQEKTTFWMKGYQNGVPNIERIHTDQFGNTWVVRSHSISWSNGKQVRHHYFDINSKLSKMGFTPEAPGSFLLSAHHLIKAGYDIEGHLELDTLAHLHNYYARDVFIDHSGMVWLGTNGYGLIKYNPYRKQLPHLAEGKSFQNISKVPPDRVFAWSKQFLWELDIVNNVIFKSADIPQKLLAARNVIADSMGVLWFHFPNLDGDPGIFSWDPSSKKSDSILYKAKPFYISPMYLDTEGFLWMASIDGILMRINLKSKQVQYFDFKSMATKDRQALFINSLIQEASGKFWLASSVGLFEFKLINNSIQQLKHHSLQTNNNTSYYVFEIFKDELEDQILWLSTRGQGLLKFHLEKGFIKQYTKKHGLPDNVIYGALMHGKELWLSSNKGIGVLNIQTEEVRSFKKEEGLQDDEFNAKSFCKLNDSILIFGGINGLNVFNLRRKLDNPKSPKVAITGIFINGQSMLATPLVSGKASKAQLKLKHDQNQISIQFASLDFRSPSQNNFQYYLHGGENNWIPLKNTNQLVLANVAPGNYEFRIKGTNNSGVWSEDEAVFRFRIRPPWWFSVPALCLYILVVSGIAYILYRYQISRAKLKNKLAFEQKEAERLQELDKLKGIFFSNITHEFKTPITLILEPIRQLLKTEPSRDIRRNLEVAERNSQKLLQLVNQLLDLSKLEEGKMKPQPSEGDLSLWLQRTASDFMPWAAQKNIQFVIKFPQQQILTFFDDKKLELIVANILSNAFKFSPANSKVTWSVSVAMLNGGYDIRMDFSDEGSGILPEDQERIFDRFHQVENEVNLVGGGTGIGLSLVKELTELLGGDIKIESTLNKGTTFTLRFEFPIVQQHGAKMSKLHDLVDSSVSTFRTIAKQNVKQENTSPIILVVEDNPDLADFIAATLSPFYEVRLATDGQEGISIALEIIPDLVISDVMMPKKNGFELCDALKGHELTDHIPIILLTAKSALEHKLEGLKTGADDYLSKPFHTEELLVRMHNLLQSRKRLRDKYGSEHIASTNEPKHWPPTQLSSRDRQFLEKIDLSLKAHLDEEQYSVEDLAAELFISRIQLYRKLKAIAETSPTDYIRNFRLEQARILLDKGQVNVNEVALQTGFSSRQYFSKAFKERFGQLPRGLKRS